jgi:hypothetical protein
MSWSWSKSAGVARNASTPKSASLWRNSTLGIPAKSAAAPADKCPSSCSFMAAASRTLPSASEGEGPSARMVASGSSMDRVTPTSVAHAGSSFVRGSARVSDASGACPTGRVRSRWPTLYRLRSRRRTPSNRQAVPPRRRRDRPGVSDDVFRLFTVEARQHCIAPAHADAVQLFSCDHAAGITALAQAAHELAEHKVDVAVVGGFDSLLHAEYLRWLWQAGRLKLPTRADGLIPGEAAAMVIVERAIDAQRRKVPALARLGLATLDRETTPIGPDHPIRAEAASRAVKAALAGAGAGPSVDQVYMDMSGERWRALEWALVETRCSAKLAKGWQLWHPADCLGDIGAATSLVHLALAVRGFARGYGGRAVLLSAASHGGERAAMTIHAPEEEPHASHS